MGLAAEGNACSPSDTCVTALCAFRRRAVPTCPHACCLKLAVHKCKSQETHASRVTQELCRPDQCGCWSGSGVWWPLAAPAQPLPRGCAARDRPRGTTSVPRNTGAGAASSPPRARPLGGGDFSAPVPMTGSVFVWHLRPGWGCRCLFARRVSEVAREQARRGGRRATFPPAVNSDHVCRRRNAASGVTGPELGLPGSCCPSCSQRTDLQTDSGTWLSAVGG